MKRRDQLKDGTLIVAMACRCSVWPIALAAGRLGRCGECGVRPKPIPDYEDLP